MKYFAYGSNLFEARLKRRVPSAKFLAVARLDHHELRFHKRSQDGSGKYNVLPARGEVVIGVMFDIPANEKAKLDQAEGLGKGYEEKEVFVVTSDGSCQTAFAYIASSDHIDEQLQPYTWYREYVVRGAIEHDFPEPYVSAIAAVPALQDPDPNREQEELQGLTTAG